MVVNTDSSGRIRVSGQNQRNNGIVCRYWKQARCDRNPCRFLHEDSPSASPATYYSSQPRSNVYVRRSQSKPPSAPIGDHQRNSQATPQKPKVVDEIAEDDGKSKETACREWISGNCFRGDECKFSHAWFRGDGLSMMGRLDGHGNSVVSGLSFPPGSDKLFSGSGDGVVQAWDCNSGKVLGTLNVGGKIGCLVIDGDLLYVGLPNMVKARDLCSGVECTLTGPTGQIYALAIGMGVIFAGAQDGVIYSWKTTADEQGNLFQPAAALIGHTIAVVSLKFEGGRLFSGSMDGTIKVWDGSTFQCLETFKGHDEAVLSLLCFSEHLLSCSLDCKIKVWGRSNGEGRFELMYTHEEADGALALCGVDLNGKPMLLCSWNNDSVGVYELPSFAKKGRMYTKGEVRSIGGGPDGMVFTGDAAGLVTVWRLTHQVEMEQEVYKEYLGVGRSR